MADKPLHQTTAPGLATDRLMAILQEGSEAHDAGIPIEHCPHMLSVYRHAWKAGWHKAKLEVLKQ